MATAEDRSDFESVRVQKGRIPDFFIVGAPKSGTTALYEMLRRHPELHMPVKEPWFFASDLEFRSTSRTPKKPETLDDYRSLFGAATESQRVGEASPLYLWSRAAAVNIFKAQPHAKVIAILREPTSFLRSLHLQLLQTHVETCKDFGTALSLEDRRRAGRHVPRSSYWPQLLFYLDHIRYVEQLRRYRDVFPASNVKVLIYEDFRSDNTGTVREVLRFLDVDDTCPIGITDANSSVRLRSSRADSLLRSVYTGRGRPAHVLKSGITAVTTQRFRRAMINATRRHLVYGTPGEADEEIMVDLKIRLLPEVEALSGYLERDLVSMWEYGDVDGRKSP